MSRRPHFPRARHGLATALVLVTLALTGCGAQEEVYVDLLDEGGGSRLWATVVLDAEGLRSAGAGWWAVEHPPQGSSFVWARSDEVGVDLDLAGGSSAVLSFRCWPYRHAFDAGAPVTVELNGRPVGEVVLAPEPTTYHLEVPEAVVVRGRNHLVLRFPAVARPADHEPGSADRRTLAAGFEWLAMAPTAVTDPAAAGEASSANSAASLTLDSGSAAVFPVTVGEGWSLEIAAEGRGGIGRAEVWIRPSAGDESVVVSELLNAGAGADWRLDLSAFAGQTVDVGLGAGGDQTGAVRWTRAAIVGPPGRPAASVNVVLVAVDTLRADFLSAYGGPARSPVIDQLAARGARFEWAYSHIPITGPSHSSIFTSLLPTEHGVHNNSEVLGSDHTTLAEALSGRGYQTAAFVSLGVLDGRFGFAQGFDHYSDRFDRDWMKNAEEINRAVIPWLDQRDDRPFFLWVHYSDPHEPYTPPDRTYPGVRIVAGEREVGRIEADGRGAVVEVELPPGASRLTFVAEDPELDVVYRFPYLRFASQEADFELGDGWETKEKRFGAPAHDSRLPATIEVRSTAQAPQVTRLQLSCKERLSVREIRDRYVAEIEYLDRILGELLATLRERGLGDDSLIIFVADHGEGLGDHNHVGHISQVYDPLIRVPLILTLPGRIPAGVVVEQRVGLVDLFPTILDAIGLVPPEGLGGQSLLPLIEGRGSDRPVVAVTYKPEAATDKKALILGGYKYIHSVGEREWEELYDLRSDPGESEDLTTTHGDELRWLRGELGQILARSTSTREAEQADLSEEDLARLRELGYVH